MIQKLEYVVRSNLFGFTTVRTDRTGQTDQTDSDQKVAISRTV
jgi:hypothetical protein